MASEQIRAMTNGRPAESQRCRNSDLQAAQEDNAGPFANLDTLLSVSQFQHFIFINFNSFFIHFQADFDKIRQKEI